EDQAGGSTGQVERHRQRDQRREQVGPAIWSAQERGYWMPPGRIPSSSSLIPPGPLRPPLAPCSRPSSSSGLMPSLTKSALSGFELCGATIACSSLTPVSVRSNSTSALRAPLPLELFFG